MSENAQVDTPVDTQDPVALQKELSDLLISIGQYQDQQRDIVNESNAMLLQIETTKKELATLLESLNSAQHDFDVQNTEIDTNNGAITSLKAKIDELTQAKAGLETDKINIQSDIDTLKAQFEQTKIDNVAALETLLVPKRQELADVSTQIDGINKDIVNACADREEVIANSEQLKKDLAGLQAQISPLQSQINDLTAKLEPLRQEFDAKTLSVSTLGAQITDLNAQITALQSTISGLNGSITDLTTQLNTLNSGIKDAQAKYTASTTRLLNMEARDQDQQQKEIYIKKLYADAGVAYAEFTPPYVQPTQ